MPFGITSDLPRRVAGGQVAVAGECARCQDAVELAQHVAHLQLAHDEVGAAAAGEAGLAAIERRAGAEPAVRRQQLAFLRRKAGRSRAR